jgi:CRP-like cAMP-binding protein
MTLARRASRDVSSTIRAFASRAFGAARVPDVVVAPRTMPMPTGRRGGGGGRWASTSRDARARASETTKTAIRDMFRHDNSAMTRARMVRVLPGGGFTVTTSVAEAAGHVSFVLLGISYLTSDLLTLRALAVGGLSAALVFQYFRDVPLWLPIRWNALFVAINVFWVAKLYYDETAARRWSSEEERALYEKHFAHMPMHEFKTLMRHGEWRDVERGFEFTLEGRANTHVHVLAEGAADVFVGGRAVNKISSGSFVGEMSLMRSIAGSNEKKKEMKPRLASATVIAAEPARVFCWDDAALRRLMKDNEQIKAGVQAAFGVGLAEKLLTTRVMSSKVFTHDPMRVRGALAGAGA